MTELLENFCTESLLHFYNEGRIDFLDYLDDNIVWYGPNENTVVRGKDNLVKALTGHSGKLKFSVENMSVDMIPAGTGCTTVILNFTLIADYMGQTVTSFGQHILASVRYRRINGEFSWNCPLIHVSDTVKSSRKTGEVFNISEDFSRRAENYIKTRAGIRKIAFRGEGNSTVYLPEDSVLYAEAGKGVKCYLHLRNGTQTVNMLLKDVTDILPNYYYRCHSSFTVNTKMITSVSAYKITLVNGDEIPIPEKKYATVKREIAELTD